VRSIDDPQLIDHLAARQVPLTLCPFSNRRLKVTPSLKNYPLRRLLDHGVCALVNSDDPAYFGGYIKRNLLAVARAQQLNTEHLFQLARNSFLASFLPEPEKNAHLREIEALAQRPPALR
jgi:adenosine deaminase